MSKAMVNYVVDAVIGVAFLIATFTGILFLLPSSSIGILDSGEPGLLGVSMATWNTLHEWSALVMIAGVILHLVLHWRWVVTMTIAAPAHAAAVPARNVLRLMRRSPVSRRSPALWAAPIPPPLARAARSRESVSADARTATSCPAAPSAGLITRTPAALATSGLVLLAGRLDPNARFVILTTQRQCSATWTTAPPIMTSELHWCRVFQVAIDTPSRPGSPESRMPIEEEGSRNRMPVTVATTKAAPMTTSSA